MAFREQLTQFKDIGEKAYSETTINFIWINYVLAGITVLLFVGAIWTWIRLGETRCKRKVLFVITAVFSMLFIALLHNWNFFVLL